MKVACIQLSSGENYNKNFKQVIFYINNDKRAKIKSEINNFLRSNIREIKQYTDY